MDPSSNHVRNAAKQEPSQSRSGLLGWLGSIFASRAASEIAGEEQQAAPEINAPACDAAEREWHDPVFQRFTSAEGDPTVVSIRRPTVLPEGVTAEHEFVAVHNYGDSHPPVMCEWARDPGVTRHTLTFSLTSFADGNCALTGSVRELGTSPLVTGPYAPSETSVMLHFDVRSDGNTESRRLVVDAFRIVEVFTNRGVWGLDEYLQQIVRAVGKENGQLFRDRSLEQQVEDNREPNS